MQNVLQSDWVQSLLGKHWGKLLILQAVILFGLGYLVASSGGDGREPAPGETNGATQADAGPQIWTCAMHPQIRRNAPGQCPLCGMDLVPVQSSTGGMRTISISPAARKLMNIETSPVERRFVTNQVRMVGKVEYDETKLARITAWVAGRLDRLFVDYTGVEVKTGDHMVSIYSEQLYSAQEELIQALKYERDQPPPRSAIGSRINLVESSREKLRLLGLAPEQIKEIEERGTPSDHITLRSQISGIVIDKAKQEGDRVNVGDRIYTVADLRQVWVKLDAYESDLEWLRYGQEVTFETEAYPGRSFSGRISFIDPVLNKDTRTVKVRVNVPNEEGWLKPEMFVTAVVRSRVAAGGRVLDASLVGKWISPMHPEIIKDEPGNCDICGMPLVRAEALGYATAAPGDEARPLVIPVQAALVTGKRAIVYVEVPTAKEPTFEGREIVLGPRAGDYYLVRRGLEQGELVVTNGNFKLDSALQISAKPSMMTPEGGGGGGHDHGSHGGGSQAAPGQMAGHAMSLPALFKSQLENVLAAFHAVTTAVEEGDVAKIRAAYDVLGQTLKEVDAKLLTGHVEMLWGEFSMLLRNDAAEGRELTSLPDADHAYPVLQRHIQRVRESFGLVGSGHEAPIIKLAAPAAFQSQLARLWQAYQPLGQALAGDDFPTAQQSIEQLPPALASIDASQLEGDVAAAWQREQANLTKIISDLRQAPDIQTARSAFALFSDEMIALVKSFGIGEAGPVFELHCPMAFDNRGASWLQSNDQTRNPYYGATMLKCADRVDRISPPDSGQTPHADHSQHDHKHP